MKSITQVSAAEQSGHDDRPSTGIRGEPVGLTTARAMPPNTSVAPGIAGRIVPATRSHHQSREHPENGGHPSSRLVDNVH
jgi:hypothetical protein